MTIASMKKWLDTFPEDTEVQVIVGDEDGRGSTIQEPLSAGTDDPFYYDDDDGFLRTSIWGENWEYVDYTRIPGIGSDRNKRVLTLGES